jgi:thioredoxin-related protein
MASKGVVVFGVSGDQGDKRVTVVKNYVEKTGITYINVVDNNNIALGEAYRITAIPTTFIIDKTGKIVDKIVGGMTKEQFEAALNKALQ